MAWQDMQKTMKILAALSEMGGKTAKGGGSKGAGGKGAQAKKKLCPWADCAAAKKHQPTTGGGPNCHCCRRPFASTPPLERLVDWAYQEKLKASPTVSKGAGKGNGKNNNDKSKDMGKATAPDPTDEELKRLREQRLAELKTAKTAKAGESPASSPATIIPGGSAKEEQKTDGEQPEAARAKVKWIPRELDGPTIDSMNLYQESFHAVVASLAEDLFPTEEELKDPAAVVAAWLALDKNCATLAESDLLRNEITTLKSQIAVGTTGQDSTTMLQNLLAQKEAALAKKKDPSSATRLRSLISAKEVWELDKQSKADRSAAGALKATARQQERITTMQSLFDHLVTITDSLKYHDGCYEEAHKERKGLLDVNHIKIGDLFDNMITEAKEKEKKAAAQPPQQAPAATPAAATDPLAQALSQLEDMRTSQAILLKKIQEMESATPPDVSIAVAEALAKAPDAAMAIPTLSPEDTFEGADPADLPDVAATAEQLTACGHLYQLLALWAQGGCQAVTFGTLSTHSIAGDETPKLLRSLLGEKLWNGWFDLLTEPIQPEEYLPRQALMFVNKALKRLKDKYEGIEETKKEAAKAYALMTAESKKRKAV